MAVRILTGDALTVLRTLESESVQCVVSSPPYFALRSYLPDGHPDKAREIGGEPTPWAFLEALWAVFDEVKRVLRPDGLAFVNIGDSYSGSGKGPSNSLQRPASCLNDRQLTNGAAPKAWVPVPEGIPSKSLMLIPQRFAIGMQERGWWVRSEIVWAKTSAMPESVKDRPTSAWEPIWMFAKSRTYYYDAEAVRQPIQASSLQRGYTYVGRPESGKKALSAPNEVRAKADWRENGYIPTGANLRNVWTLGPEPSNLEHYAGFPTALPRRCILAGSRPGDTVLDPFLGSGTTALVADRLGRDAVGIELNPEYAEMARRRIEADAPMVSEPVRVETPTQGGLFDEAAG